MFFEFIKKHRIKTLLIGAGFLVVAAVMMITCLVYFSFLVSRDVFFSAAPAQTVFLWHLPAGQAFDETWFDEVSRGMLSGEAANQAQFLFDVVAPKSSDTAFAVLPGFDDFIFWGRLGQGDVGGMKEKLEEFNFSYISEDGGRVTITNTKFALKEVLAVMSGKNFSLADNRGRLAAWNRASRGKGIPVYLGNDFQWQNFPALPLHSDFWEANRLDVRRNDSNFVYLLSTDNDYLRREAENILRSCLAILLPRTAEKKLPDETVVKEIIADPEVFSFGQATIAGQETDYLSVPELGQEFFVARPEDQTVLSTSKDFLANFLVRAGRQDSYYGKNIIELGNILAKWITSDFDGVVFRVNVDKL